MNNKNIITVQPVYTLADILGDPYSDQELNALLDASPESRQSMQTLPNDHQEKLLSFLRGKRGLAITYDSFFKKIMNPEEHPERLESFLTAILEQKVKIHTVLPVEGQRFSETGSFVIMDLLAELENGSIIDVEIQKSGYAFPGERSCCYVSDLTLRQYNRVKSEKGDKFSFRDMKPVIMIVIMENSSKNFKEVYPHYIHRERITYDSGAEVSSLFKITYVSLDTFHSVVQNISNKLEAWLTFLSSDDPERIVQLVNTYPEFLECYHDIRKFRRNVKELMQMYSVSFEVAERNAVKLTLDEWAEEVKEVRQELAEKNATIAALQAEIEQLKKQQNQKA